MSSAKFEDDDDSLEKYLDTVKQESEERKNCERKWKLHKDPNHFRDKEYQAGVQRVIEYEQQRAKVNDADPKYDPFFVGEHNVSVSIRHIGWT